MKDLTVIIVSYNVRHYLRQCLHSVFAAQGSLDLEVFVVDNNSCDGSVSYLQPLFPQVQFIQNTDNRGFSQANNQAIRLATGRYILLLNPDTIVTENTLTDCFNYLEGHPEVGATGTAMYNANGHFAWESRRGVPTPWTSFCKMIGLTSLFPHSRRFGRYYMRYLSRQEANYIEIISGAFMMLRTKALEQVGMLDETFFMYGEDIDLSYRMLLGGWRNAYVPAPILHYKGESTQKSSYRYVHIFYQAMLIFFDKHFRSRYRITALIIRLAVYMRAAMDMAIRLFQRPLSLLPRRKPILSHYICIGTPGNIERMRHICQQNGLNATYLTPDDAMPPKDSKTEQFIIFDTSVFTYGQILDRIIQLSALHRRVSLGTFNPESGIIIFEQDVYEEGNLKE